jgi:hypothetical protein
MKARVFLLKKGINKKLTHIDTFCNDLKYCIHTIFQVKYAHNIID